MVDLAAEILADPNFDADEPRIPGPDGGPGGGAAEPEAAPQAELLDLGDDIELARRVRADLEQKHGETVHTEGQFWRHAGTHWEALAEHELRLFVHRYAGALVANGAARQRVKLNKGRVDSVLHELAAMLERPGFFDEPEVGINCRSGFIRVLPFGLATLEPHKPEHRCRHTLPGRWKPDTDGTPPEGSLLAKLRSGAFLGDADAQQKVDLLAEIIGAAALGYATRLLQPRAVLLHGPTAENGKSQILDLARGVLPPSAVSCVTTAKLGDERHIVGLVGKLLNASDEVAADAGIAGETFKQVVTGEPVAGRDVYKSRVEFRARAQHIFAVNQLPPFKGGMDRGVRRRLLVIEFNRSIPLNERVQDIGKRIATDEADALLAWAVEGARRVVLLRNFSVPQSSIEALQGWLTGADPVLAWLDECVEVVPIVNDGPRVRTNYAYQQFTAWAQGEGFRLERLPAIRAFVQRVHANAAGVEYRRTHDGRFFLGVSIRLEG